VHSENAFAAILVTLAGIEIDSFNGGHCNNVLASLSYKTPSNDWKLELDGSTFNELNELQLENALSPIFSSCFPNVSDSNDVP